MGRSYGTLVRIFICGHGLKSMVTILVEPLVLFSFLIEYGPHFLSIDKESDGVYMGRSYRTLVLFLFVAMD